MAQSRLATPSACQVNGACPTEDISGRVVPTMPDKAMMAGTEPKPTGKVEFGIYTGTGTPCLEKQFVYDEFAANAKSMGGSLGETMSF